nr:MAG TPA: hypothetical protein [Caudoviricetes sp.]
MKKRNKTGRFTKEAAAIVVEMLKDDAVKGKLRTAGGGEVSSVFGQDLSNIKYPYRIGWLTYTMTLQYYKDRDYHHDIVGFTDKADRKEFKRRWRARYPKGVKTNIELTYPLFAKSKLNAAVFLFTSERDGVCVRKSDSGGNLPGQVLSCLVKATDTAHWQHLTFAEAEAEIFGM